MLVYVLANVAVSFLLLQVLRLTSVSVMNGTTLVGFVASFVFLAWYQLDSSAFGSPITTPAPRHAASVTVTWMLVLFGFLVLLIGKVLYQWDHDPDLEATTTSAEDKEARALLTDRDSMPRYS